MLKKAAVENILNIIFGVDNKDFDNAIKVLYNSFITK